VESLILSAITQADLFYVLNLAKNLGMVAVMLGFVIFVHELGHFLVAKACGVKCEKFYIGFNFFNIPLGFVTIPATLFKVQWGETEYGIGSFPLGGYVKMLGQDDNPNNAETESDRTKLRDEAGNVRLDPRSYPAKSVPQRMAIISAGVIMNIIFGVIFAAIAYRNGVLIQPAVVGATSPGDPAWKANLQVGDRILQVGNDSYRNEHMRFVDDMSKNLFLYGSYDKDLDVVVRHANGDEETVTMRPSSRHRDSKQKDLPPRPTLGLTNGRSLEIP
jgi:regulator of sigma E protease